MSLATQSTTADETNLLRLSSLPVLILDKKASANMTDFPLAVARPSADEIQAHLSSFRGSRYLTRRRTAELQRISTQLIKRSAVEQECEVELPLQASHGSQVKCRDSDSGSLDVQVKSTVSVCLCVWTGIWLLISSSLAHVDLSLHSVL